MRLTGENGWGDGFAGGTVLAPAAPSTFGRALAAVHESGNGMLEAAVCTENLTQSQARQYW
jgi:hypothetical protein